MTATGTATAAVLPHRVARRRPGDRERRTGSFPPLRGLLPLAACLLAWQLLAGERSLYFPPPSRWIEGVSELWQRGLLGPAAAQTLSTFAVGLSLATVVGVVVGLSVGSSSRVDKALAPTFEFARAMPPAAVVPIAALLIGYDGRMKVTVVAFAAVWPVLLNTRAGMHTLDPVLLDTARCLRLSRLDTSRKCLLPALLPSISLGVRVAAPVALVITLLVEIVTRIDGIGALIATAQRSYLSGQVYGLLLVACAFSFAVNGLVSLVQAYALRNWFGR